MTHEKIITHDNGDKVRITIFFYCDYSGHKYNIRYVEVKPKGKRTWKSVHSSDDDTWRRLDSAGRAQYEMNICLQYVTSAEIMQAKLELWEQLKPATP
jgi:hypothetical protein